LKIYSRNIWPDPPTRWQLAY